MNKKLNYIQNLNFKFKFKGKWKRCIFLLHFRIKLTVLLLPGHTDSFVFFSQRKKTASRVLFVYLPNSAQTNQRITCCTDVCGSPGQSISERW